MTVPSPLLRLAPKVVLTLGGLGLAAAAGWLIGPMAAPPAERILTAPAAPAAETAAAPLAVAPAADEVPRIDVARIGARGTLVAAGRATAGAEVALLAGQAVLGLARADGRGEWVILPDEPLRPGAAELRLVARRPGEAPVFSAETLLLVVPEPAAAELPAPQPTAMLLPPTASRAGPRMLQGPPVARGRLGLDLIDYDDAGEMRFAGSAAPGATVRVYVGRAHAGDAVADASGRWLLVPAEQPGVGRNAVRVDQLAAAGTVAARVELPFQRDPPQATAEGRPEGTYVVQPGHNLWRIARAAYGRGTRYTVIVLANREQIRDPARIYPGQVFALPDAAAQLDSSRSR